MSELSHPSGPSLPVAIQALHAAIAEHPDPASKQTLTQCLQNMLRVQAQDMQAGQGQGQGQPQAGTPAGLQGLLASLGGGQ